MTFIASRSHRASRVVVGRIWSRAYSLLLDGQARVVRFGDHVEDFRKDQIMAAYSTVTLPIPAVIEIGPARGGYFAVSERAFGQHLDHLDGAGMRAALPSLCLLHICLDGMAYTAFRRR
jgi:hypothetical protein